MTHIRRSRKTAMILPIDIQLPKNRAVLSFYNGEQVEESRVVELLPYYQPENNLFPSEKRG